MNKLHVILTLIVVLLVITGCKKQVTTSPNETTVDPKLLNDKIKPIITITIDEQHVIIDQGTEYDLLKGVKGLDNLEGDITSRIEINTGNYNKDVPGEYEIFYFLSDTAGNAADTKSRIIVVRDTAIFKAPPVYTGDIPNEKPAPEKPNSFPGAWYHKVVSSRDVWYGIEGTVTLPQVDINRYSNNSYDDSLDVDPYAKNLDNPSIYMGGKASSESDVGLSYSRGCIGKDCTDISIGSFVFRPFWRYITTSEFTDEGGYEAHNGEYAVGCTGSSTYKNCIANWHYRYTEYYYLPGDKLRMIIVSPVPNYIQLQIEVLEVSTLPESVKIREENGWNEPKNFKSPIFHSQGHGSGQFVEYKRVNAIDQSTESGSNEGKPEIDTTTEITNAIWHNTYLYRKINGTMYRVPMTSERSNYIDNPDPKGFTVIKGDYADVGGEIVNIHPGRRDDED